MGSMWNLFFVTGFVPALNLRTDCQASGVKAYAKGLHVCHAYVNTHESSSH